MELFWVLDYLTANALLDIFIVTLVFFGISFFIRGTQAVALLRGILLVISVVVIVSSIFNLQGLRWLLENLLTVIAIAIPVIFQPELRRALERLGRAGLLINRQPEFNVRTKIIEDICVAAERLSERRHGALIVLERNSSLQEYIRTGISMDADVTPQLLLTIFWPKTELHDGAVIIGEKGKVASAASVLPLSSSRNLTTPKLGTRHRAAIGISEVSDAIVVVVSEETGRISVTNGGRLIPRLDPKRLRTILNAFYGPERERTGSPWQRFRDQIDSIGERLRERRKNA
jgi:diadenylate cyclase